MLRITIADIGQSITLKLEGKLSGPWVEELEHCWNSTVATHPNRCLALDLTGLLFVDAQGKKLLNLLHARGTKLEGTGLMTQSLIQEITGRDQKKGESWTEPLKHSTLKVILFFLLLPLVGMSRGEAEDAASPLRLTLREAVQMALKQNPQVQIANLNVAQSEQDSAVSRADLLPQVGLEGFDKVQRFNLAAFIGKPFPGTPQHAGPFQVFQAGPGFSMPLLDLTLWRRWQAARHGVRASESQEMGVREQMVLLVVSQYLGSLRAAAAVKAASSRVELAQALYDQALDLQKHGVGTGIDTLRANVQLQNERQGLIVAETQLKTSLFSLARLLNLDAQRNVELTDEMSFFETPAFEASQSLEEALRSRPEMKALEARELIVQAQKRAAGEARLPKLSLNGGWAYQGLSLATSIPSYQYQVTLDVPLFTSGKIRAENTRASLELKKVEQERLELRNQIALEVKNAVALLESARSEVDVANLGVKLAGEEVSQARDRFSAGVANNIEVVSAQDALSRANDNQIVALYRYNQARADLAHAIGQMESLYAK